MVSLQADRSHNVIFILSKYGRLYIAELESAIVLSSVQVSTEITFRCSLDALSALTIVSRSSQVCHPSLSGTIQISCKSDFETILNDHTCIEIFTPLQSAAVRMHY